MTINKQFEKDLNKLANKLGMGKVVPYSVLWGTKINTYGRRDASMWFFTIELSDSGKICGIEINSTYFKPSPQVLAVNKVCDFENQKSIQECMKLLNS
jgi:hypothetical protein